MMTDNPLSDEGDFEKIPIIDLSLWSSPNPDDRKRLVKNVYDACTQVGFFYLKNHGIAESLIEGVHEVAKRFFSLPEDVKMQCFLGKSKEFRGFSPLFAELSTGADLDDPEDRAKQVSYSEGFDIGYEIDGDSSKKPGDSLPPDRHDMYGENQWPRGADCPGFRQTLLQYYAAALDLTRELMRIFAQALDLEPDFFEDKMKHPGAMARLLHYPPQLLHGQSMPGLAAHTDYECVTVLSQGPVPALQVMNTSGEWVRADPIPGTLVTNIGDCLAMWTNKKFKSTIHRVRNLTGEERYTVPFFFGVDYDVTISALDKFVSEDSPPSSDPIKAGDYVRQKLCRSYVGYGGAPPDPEIVKNILAGAVGTQRSAQE